MAPKFNLQFEPAHGHGVQVAAGVVRVTARNPGPFTFHGTNTYLVGRDTLAIIDPGPDDDEHLDTLLRVIDGRHVSHIFVSHTHRDHSPLAARLTKATGAPTHGEGPHRAARPDSGLPPLENGADRDFRPDIFLSDGQVVEGEGWALKTVLTPGHAANHAAFALEGTGILFSADHVMGWSTTVVAPPDGSMADYMASLDRLIARADRLLLPGHGGEVADPATYMRDLKEHRIARERAILDRLRQGDRRIEDIVRAIYREIDPRMYPAAALSVLAHIEELIERGQIESEGIVSVGGVFRPV